MAIPTYKLDRAALETQVFEIARELLAELGSHHALGAVRGSAHLDRDLGLGSLERVELFVRLERAWETHLPERIVAEADTLDDVVAALAETLGSDRVLHLGEIVLAYPPVAPTRSEPSDSNAATPSATTVAPQDAAPPPATAETWQEVLRYRASADSARPHLILWDEDGKSQRVSFGDLFAGATTVAGALSRRGIARGDAVALMLPTCREFFLVFAGVLLAGGVPVPIYPPVRADRIAEYAERQSAILRNAEARLLVTFHEAARVAKMLEPSVPGLRGIVTAAALLQQEATKEEAARPSAASTSSGRARGNDLALLQYTSGSTGNPKGVMLTHANLLANVRAIGAALSIRGDDVGVTWLPLYHDMGLIGAWLMPLYFGLTIVVLSPIAFLTRPERWLWALHEYRGTITAAPNFAYELAVRKVPDAQIEGLDLSPLRASLNGAEPVNTETLDRFIARFAPHGLRGEALVPVYGLAEGSLAVTIPPLGRRFLVDRIARETLAAEGRAIAVETESGTGDLGALSVVSVGRPLPEHEVRIVDAAGREVDERIEGTVWFRGPSTTSGYFHNPEASSALFPEGEASGWLNSGDRGYCAGGELFITGRVKDIILKAGRNLYPHEVEEVSGRVPGVRKGCVVAFGAPDAATGTERLIVVAETRERALDARQRLAAAITEQLARAIGVPPDTVALVPPHSIPKTSSGKLRRNETKQLFLAGSLGSARSPAWLQISRLAATAQARRFACHLRRALDFLYGVYAGLSFICWLVPTWILVILVPSRRAAVRITSAAVRGYFATAGCRIRVVGRDNWDLPGPRVIVSNHTSFADVLALMGALGIDYHFVAKQEVRKMPLIGTFLRKLGHFAFDRGDPQARLQQVKQIEQALGRGESVFVFPEGTFTPQPGVRAFHLGAFKAAVTAHCPVIPVALAGTRRFLPDGAYLPRPERITITICPPIAAVPATSDSEPGARAAEWKEIVRLRDHAREAIARESGEPLL